MHIGNAVNQSEIDAAIDVSGGYTQNQDGCGTNGDPGTVYVSWCTKGYFSHSYHLGACEKCYPGTYSSKRYVCLHLQLPIT